MIKDNSAGLHVVEEEIIRAVKLVESTKSIMIEIFNVLICL